MSNKHGVATIKTPTEHVAANAGMADMLATTVRDTFADHEEACSSHDQAERLLRIEPGDATNRYRIIRKLATGGQGRIYLAVDMETEAHVALKTIRNVLLDSATVQRRLRREALAIAPLAHPNIVRIHHAFVFGNAPFLVTEYVAGQTLADAIYWKSLSHRQLLEIFITYCEAMEYVHERGIVHFDLKPQNILISSDGVPKIADFGIARNMCRPRESRLDLIDGKIAGSPAYISPEQAANRQDLIGPRSDVYGLGIILYQILTGELPHVDETPHLTMQRVINSDPEPPIAHDPFIGWDLNAICIKALSRNPEDRYPAAATIAADLLRYLAGQPPAVRLP